MDLHVRTTTIGGFLPLWLLARLRRLRPISYRARHEHRLMDCGWRRWSEARGSTTGSAASRPRPAQLVKGYGDVRRRMTAARRGLLESVLAAAAFDPAAARELAAEYRTLALQGPEGETAAGAAAARVLEWLDSNAQALGGREREPVPPTTAVQPGG